MEEILRRRFWFMITLEGALVESAPLFRLEGVSKSYGGVRALQKADLDIYPGRIHGILGENGAGKSTLIKAMAGVVAPDEGRMFLDGKEISFASPTAANKAGIVCIFQELSLIPDLSVADNIVISDPPTRFGMIDRTKQRQIAEAGLGPGRSRRHSSACACKRPPPVAPPDGGNRQGAGAQATHPHSR